MPYKMLVASDIDDTLLPEGQTRLNPALFDEIVMYSWNAPSRWTSIVWLSVQQFTKPLRQE